MRRSAPGDWQLKLLSVVLAVGLWLFVGSAERTEIALAVPIEYVGLEGPLTLEGARRETVDVQLQATRWGAERVSPATVRVRVDVSGLREGDNLVHLVPESVQAPPGVRVTQVAPAWTGVRVVRTETRTVQVLPQVQGRPADTYVLDRVVVRPPTVQIRGPRTTIEAQTAIETLPVDVSGHRAPLTRAVGLALPDSVSVVDQRTVEVTVNIRPEGTMHERAAGPRR
jgi:YbbR domain-containing protein